MPTSWTRRTRVIEVSLLWSHVAQRCFNVPANKLIAIVHSDRNGIYIPKGRLSSFSDTPVSVRLQTIIIMIFIIWQSFKWKFCYINFIHDSKSALGLCPENVLLFMILIDKVKKLLFIVQSENPVIEVPWWYLISHQPQASQVLFLILISQYSLISFY